jgi:hypothetical protein
LLLGPNPNRAQAANPGETCFSPANHATMFLDSRYPFDVYHKLRSERAWQ